MLARRGRQSSLGVRAVLVRWQLSNMLREFLGPRAEAQKQSPKRLVLGLAQKSAKEGVPFKVKAEFPNLQRALNSFFADLGTSSTLRPQRAGETCHMSYRFWVAVRRRIQCFKIWICPEGGAKHLFLPGAWPAAPELVPFCFARRADRQ